MLASFPISILVGTVLGFLAGLGVGGGSLLMLWLTFVLGLDHSEARTINLLFFLPAALVACCFRWKQGNIRWMRILPGILCGCAAAGVFSWLAGFLNMELLKKLFGGLLIITGLRELFFRPRK